MHPHLFQFGHLILPTFGAWIALGLIAALLVCLRISRLLALDTGKVCNLSLLMIVIALAGAKLVLAASHWRRYGVHALMFPLAGADHAQIAGFACALVLGWIYARKVQLPLRRTADALAPALAVASSVYAIACFEAGYGYGKPTQLPWAVVYLRPSATSAAPIGIPLHPVQIYAGLLEFVLFTGLLWLLHRPHEDGEVMGAWLYLSGLGEFLLAWFRGDGWFAGVWSTTPWIAVAMVVSGGVLWLRRPAGRVRYGG